jgi:hypothetical protein
MKKFQSALCTLVLALSLSSTVFAGNIHAGKATAPGDIHGTSASGILVSDLLSWGTITGVLVRIVGNIHG